MCSKKSNQINSSNEALAENHEKQSLLLDYLESVLLQDTLESFKEKEHKEK